MAEVSRGVCSAGQLVCLTDERGVLEDARFEANDGFRGGWSITDPRDGRKYEGAFDAYDPLAPRSAPLSRDEKTRLTVDVGLGRELKPLAPEEQVALAKLEAAADRDPKAIVEASGEVHVW